MFLLRLLAFTLWRGLLYGALSALAFAAVVFCLHKSLVEGRPEPLFFRVVPFPLFAAVYVIAGFVSGGAVGAASASARKKEEILATLHPRLERLFERIVERLLPELAGQSPQTVQQLLEAQVQALPGPLRLAARGVGPGRMWEALVERRFLRAAWKAGELWAADRNPLHCADPPPQTVKELLRNYFRESSRSQLEAQIAVYRYGSLAVLALMLIGPVALILLVG
jgi:hypothetical protein